jgi:hypothetical protein
MKIWLRKEKNKNLSKETMTATSKTPAPPKSPAVPASQLIDPEDMLINSSINQRGYKVRCSISRATTLLDPEWKKKFEDKTKELILMSLDTKVTVGEDNTYHGTIVYDMATGKTVKDAICVVFISSSNTVFFHFWSNSFETSEGWCQWVQETFFIEKIANVFDEEKGARDITFWGQSGGDYESFNRKVVLLDWNKHVEVNYPERVKGELQLLRDLRAPIEGGKIILMHGEPGTGKTSFIRALARQWTDWCHTSYITDPENFLGHPGSMLKVIAWNFNSYIASGVKPEDAYHLLVIEDADELIAADAKRKSGQALSRLLNVGDGLLGQSTNLLICITTNVPVGDLHPAVSRAGRSLANIHFDKFSYAESVAWLSVHYPEMEPEKVLKNREYTLAELYQSVAETKQIVHAAPLLTHGTYL